MKNTKKLNGGYVGLLMLLISVAIIVFLMVRSDMFSGQKGSKSSLEQDKEAIDQAKAAKAMIELNNRKSTKEN